MKLEIALIRNGHVSISDERLVGFTSESLDEEGKRQISAKIQQNSYPAASQVFSEGSTSCVETAIMIYKNVPAIILNKCCAPDYGDFEGRLYSDLAQDEEFAKWSTSGGIEAYPNGELHHQLLGRATTTIREISEEMGWKGIENAALIASKALIEAVISRFCVPRSSYIEREIPHSGGYLIVYNTVYGTAKILDKL